MKIKNHTSWDTKDLRKFFSAICDSIGVEKYHRTIEVNPYQRGWTGGRGTIGGRWLMVVLKNTITEERAGSGIEVNGQLVSNSIYVEVNSNELPRKNKESFAKTFLHELRHNQGLDHKDMLDEKEEISQEILDLSIRKAIPEEKSKIDIREIRYQKALKKVKEYQSKVKRNNNILKKWLRKVKYYEKVVSLGKSDTVG